MQTAAIYVRVSTPGQVENGFGATEGETSPHYQLLECRALAERFDLNVPDDFVITEQASGAYIERDGLDRVRDLIASKRIQALIVWKVDRIARDEALVGQLVVLNEAKNAAVTVYAVDKGGAVENTMEGNLVNVVNAYVAASEKDAFRRRSIAGKRSKAMNEGVLPIGTGIGIYGYDYKPRVKRNKQTGDPGSSPTRVINANEAEVVRRMFQMALEGLGAHRIAVILNGEGTCGKTGSLWHPWTVKNTLRNPAYMGVTRYGMQATKLMERGRRERHRRDASEVINIDGFTPAIIETATFNRVQAHLSRPRTSGHALEPYLLSGMLKCSCGTGMVAHAMWHGKYRYYSCRGNSATATRPRSCWSKRTRMDGLDERVMTAITNAVADPDFLHQRVLAHNLSSTDISGIDLAKETKARKKELVRAERGLLTALMNAPSAADSIAAELEKIAKERKDLERALQAPEKAQGASGCPNISQDAIQAFSKRVAARLGTMEVEELHRLLSLVGFEAIVDANGEVQASIAVPVTPENYLPLHEHGHDNVNVVVVVDGPDDAGAG